jgi:aspartate/methionine/tyrosine aminotransferase
MTRLAIKHGAVNLSQGFPNEPPPREMALAAAGALLDGSSPEAARVMATKLSSFCGTAAPKDALNQYSFPFGAPDTRAALSQYYRTFYPGVPADAEENLTIVLGATEGFAVCLRAICSPGDTVAFFQPFHELYPSQCVLWGLSPRAITLLERDGSWTFDEVPDLDLT